MTKYFSEKSFNNWSKELDGKKPPFETNVILKFKLLNNLMLEKFKSIKLKKLKKYILEILIILFIKFSSEDRLMFVYKTNHFVVILLQKILIIKILRNTVLQPTEMKTAII